MSALPQPWRGPALFALLSGADLALTCRLLSRPTAEFYEANSLAATVLEGYGFTGLALYKAALVVLTASLVGLVARYRPTVARRLGTFACGAVGLVVLYSAALWVQATPFAAPDGWQNAVAAKQAQALDQTRDRRKVYRAALEHWERTLAAGRCTLSEAVAELSAVPEARRIAACLAWYRAEGMEGTNRDAMAALLVHGALDLLTKDGSPAARTRGERLLTAYRDTYGPALLAYVQDGLGRNPGISQELPQRTLQPGTRPPGSRFAASQFHTRHHRHAFRFGHARRPTGFNAPLWPLGWAVRG